MSQDQDCCVVHAETSSAEQCQNCESGLCAKCHLHSRLCPSCRRGKLSKILVGSLAALAAIPLVFWIFTLSGLPSVQYGKNRFEIQKYKKALELEPCNRQEAINLATTLYQSNVYLETAEFGETFVKRCGEFIELRLIGFEALKGLGKWDEAAKEISKVIEQQPGDSSYYAHRGLVFETTGQWEKAEADFKKSLSISPGLIDVPLNLATAQERLGKTCEAVTTLSGVLAKAGDAYGRDEVFARLVTLNQKGKCIAGTERKVPGKAVILYAPGSKAISTEANVNNGQLVSFIVDTGASYVTVSKRIANKLKLKLGTPVRIKTADGETTGFRSTMDSIRIQGVEARNVPVVILEGAEDNLLGLSFLSQFKMEMHNAQGTLRLQSRGGGAG